MRCIFNRWKIGWLGLLLLSACGHTPVTMTLAKALESGPPIDQIQLHPDLRYLRVSLGGREALMVLGYAEQSSHGPIEVWYSSQGEVLQLQNGRILSTAGLALDWRRVEYRNPPAWSKTFAQSSHEFVRVRDQMPDYRFGITETISFYPIAVPKDARLVGLPASQLSWFEERVIPNPDGLASARFGLHGQHGETQVVYAEQCLSAKLCIAWQKWPPSLCPDFCRF